MPRITLRIPDETMLPEIAAYRSAMLAAGSSMDGCSLLGERSPQEWLDFIRLTAREESCPDGWMPCNQYVAVRESDGCIVGMIQLRRKLNAYLRDYGGHVGYSVRPDERRKGYATQMLQQLLPLARTEGLNRLLVTCDEVNEASRRTILRCGGAYESTVLDPSDGMRVQRYWIQL